MVAHADEHAHRLHPKLRVVRNGSALVNSCRSRISTTVVSTAEQAADAALESRLELDLGVVQESIHNLGADLSGLVKGGLATRPVLKDEAPADKSYVNVFIEIVRGRKTQDGEDEISTADRIVRSCRAALKKTNPKLVRGSVIRRRNFVSATVPISLLPELEREPNVAFVHPAESLKLDLPETETAKRPTSRKVGKANLHKSGAGVMIGIIDVGGFDFAHPDFLDVKDKTRFVSIWDQGGDFRAPPPRFGYGAEFTKKHLDTAISASKKRGNLPATLLEPQSQQTESSHATHVASIAGGKSGLCPKAELAAVLIDIPQSQDQRERRRFTFSDSSRITHAVEYLLDLAKARDMPISINISLGTNGGAHDGSSGVSRWIDAALSTPGRCVCAAAGNAGQEAATEEGDLGWIMGRIHTSGKVASRGLDVDLEWTVVGNGIADISENELEIWYGAQDRFSVMVQPPGSRRWIEVKPREFVENKRLGNGTNLSIYNELYHPTNGANYISIYLSPNLQPGQIRGIEAGVWRVRLRGEEVRDGSFHGWIERDDPQEIGSEANRRLFRFPSFFSSGSNVDTHSISSLACGHRVIAVANLDTAAGRINITSSQGPTRDKRYKPDIAAAGTNIVAAKGFSLDKDSWVSMTGTSMASPYVTGVIGLMLAANPELTAAQCSGILQRTARPLPGDSYEWRDDAGFGQVDPQAAVEEAHTFNIRIERR